MDSGRFFPNKALNDPSLLIISDDKSEECAALPLLKKCLRGVGEHQHHEEEAAASSHPAASNNSSLGTLYCGELGPRVYLRYLMAKHLLEQKETTAKKQAEAMLQKALSLAQSAVRYEAEHYQNRRASRVTLLESPWVGARAMEICLLHQLGQTQEAREKANQLVALLRVGCHSLADFECEVLYGRAGAMQAILFLRQELQDVTLGSDLLCELALAILQHGHKEAKRRSRFSASTLLPLHWEWHDTTYLGTAHGVVGILHTILSLNPGELQSLNEKIEGNERVEDLILGSIRQLDTYWCFPSGNLKSSMESERTDRLVHWCHGAPGHVLLLIKAGEVFDNDQFIQRAKDIANHVIWPRGLLRKGVGLCHGISGNAFVFLALARTVESTPDDASWLAKAQYFANFAQEHLQELERVPDRPYSLFGGVGGLCALVLALAHPETEGRFPLYDF